ncbi:hypothetical protein RUMCAL_01287, partial [Ruminococcus callidus ATCC 27760]
CRTIFVRYCPESSAQSLSDGSIQRDSVYFCMLSKKVQLLCAFSSCSLPYTMVK